MKAEEIKKPDNKRLVMVTGRRKQGRAYVAQIMDEACREFVEPIPRNRGQKRGSHDRG